MTTAGVILTVAGGITSLAGAIDLGASRSDGTHDGGLALLSGGVTAMMFGVPMLFLGQEPEVRRARRDEGVMFAGSVLTSVGTSMLVSGIVVNRATPEGTLFPDVKLMVVGGALTLIGLPLWIGGGASASASDEAPPQSYAMKYVGILSTVLGVVAIGAGGFVAITAGPYGGSVGLGVLGAGGALLAIGIPLWIIGGSSAPRTPRSAFRPSVSVGAGFVGIGARFD